MTHATAELERTSSAEPPHEAALTFDAVVLGAGISGLVAASVLVQQGSRSVLVVDEYEHIGGNHIDCAIGAYTFDVGSFIFQDDSPLLKHFPELMSLYEPVRPSWARLNPQRRVTAYPISVRDDILRAGIWPVCRIAASVAWARVTRRRMVSARDFAAFWIGPYLLNRSGLETYMGRFYGVPPEQIDIELAQKRMLWISEHARLRNVARKLFAPGPGPTNTQLVRPRAGFAPLYELARRKLESLGVTFMLGAELRRLEKEGARFILHTRQRSLRADRIVSTIPIPAAEELCGITPAPLKMITLVSLFYSFAGARGFVDPILYNFSHDGAWKRLTMHSDFYGATDDRAYFSVEVIGNAVGNSVAAADQDFRGHMAANGLFAGDLRLEGSHILDHAYPIYSAGSAAQAARSIAALRAFGVESFGRQGAFNYQPTARVSTIEAEQALTAPAVVSSPLR